MPAAAVNAAGANHMIRDPKRVICPALRPVRSSGGHYYKPRVMPRTAALIVAMVAISGCTNATPGDSAARAPARPSILLVTLDTTRADAIGPEAAGIETPSFNALATRGRRFRQAYAAVPETL